ncbi:MAG: hypothetical protein JNJ57_14885 [Saprospiraceae bacterium]|nr:hypothetical protein [Saprospiraceae bacterium]
MHYSLLSKFLLSWAINIAQQPVVPASDTLYLYRSIKVEAVYATADQLDNTYVVTTENSVEKFDRTGRRAAYYTNRRLGDASYIDATNPMKILVWYPDFQTVVFLDRTMNEMGRLKFSEIGFTSVRAIAMASDGNIWLFDDAISKAVKLNAEGAAMFQSQPLNLQFKDGFSPTRIRDNGTWVYLSDPQNGLCTLDQYANLIQSNAFLKTADFDLTGEWLVFTASNLMHLENTLVRQHQSISLPVTTGAWYASSFGLFHAEAGNLDMYRWVK